MNRQKDDKVRVNWWDKNLRVTIEDTNSTKLFPLIVRTPSFSRGEVSFKYLPRRRDLKNKKGGRTMVKGQVFLKGEAGTFAI